MKLLVENLNCIRSGKVILKDISLSVSSGSAVIIEGPNGSGKTTLLKCIAGLLPILKGRIYIESQSNGLTNNISSGSEGFIECISFIGHLNALKLSLSPRENIEFWCRLNAFVPSKQSDTIAILKMFDLDKLAEVQTSWLSAGQQRRLSLCRLVTDNRVVWLLDEPTVGLDIVAQEKLTNIMQKHLDSGGMIIATSHIDIGLTSARRFNILANKSNKGKLYSG